MDGPIPPAKFKEFQTAKAKRANAEAQSVPGGRRRLVRAGFLDEVQGDRAGATRGVAEERGSQVDSVRASSVGSVETGATSAGALAAGAAEARIAAEAGRGIGDEAKVARMQMLSAVRGREEQGGGKKK